MDKTERTILLEPGNRILWIFMGVIFFINGITNLANEQLEWYSLILGIAMIALSIIYAFYSVLAFSEKSKYSPKVRMNNKLIQLKSSFWKRGYLINWSDVKLINFGRYKVEFELSNGTKAFPYNTESKKSKELKSMLREFAESQSIQVIGG